MVGQWLAIHAGKHWDPEDVFDILTHLPRGTVVRETFTLRMLMEQLGHIVAVARIAGTVTSADLRQMAERARPWFVGPVGWVLDSVTAIEPVQCKGAQGLWTLPPDVLAQVRDLSTRPRRSA